MNVTKRLALAGLGLSVAGTLIGASVANADPIAPPANAYDRPLHGEGSDTTEEVMNAMAEAIIGDHDSNPGTPDQKLIASWNAKGSTGFQTRSSGCVFTGNPDPSSAYVEGARANGSGNGQRALRDAATIGKPTFGCLDFARSSSNPSAGNLGTVEVRAVHLATDSLTFALNRSTSIPRQLTKQQLFDIYHCTFGGFTGATPARKALIPQAGSGTRASWLAVVGLTEADLAPAGSYPCVSDQADGGARGGSNPLQEHDLRSLKSTQIAPISTAAWISQMGGAATDLRGNSMLGGVTAASGEVSYAVGMNPSYGDLVGSADDVAATRTVYNVLPLKTSNGAAYSNPLATLAFLDTNADPSINTSLICQRADIIKKFGYAPITTCGTGSIVNPQP